MKAALLKSKVTVPLAGLLAALLANVFQFPAINSDVPTHHKALHRYETHDVIELGASNVENTHNLFTAIDEYTDSPTIIVPKGHSFMHSGNNYRARLLGLTQPEKIKEADLDMGQLHSAFREIEQDPSAQDYIWEWPGAARDEDMETATKWSLYLSDQNPPVLVLIDTDQEEPAKWKFVDAALLPADILDSGTMR